MTNVSTANTSTEEKALELLATGIEQVHVASALGVTEGRISQIISNPLFAQRLAELRFTQLKKHNETDNKYDALEKKVLDRLDKSVDYLMDPMKLAHILAKVNAAKRRGSSAPDSLVRSKPTIRLNINTAVMARFQVNAANQVVQASIGSDSQDLVTIQSSGVQRLLNEHVKTITADAIPVPDAIHNSREWRAYRREVKAVEAADEINGKIWRKSQGRESVDLLEECGFTHEIVVSTEVQSDEQQPSGSE